jgi:hypothetical protein
MTLEISLHPPLSISRVLRAHSDEPQQEYHWIGRTQEARQGNTSPGKQGENPQEKKGKKGHRPLSTITNDEVDEIARLYEPQLVHSPLNGWIARNNFCRVHLKSQFGKRPSVVFGRVKSCYPEEGHADNVQEFELLFPNKGAAPDVIQVRADIINFDAAQPVESFCLRTRFFFLVEEMDEFRRQDDLFLKNGFAPEIKTDYTELLEMDNQNQHAHPWLYVIGSRWFASIPESRFYEIKGALKDLIGWEKTIVNYHPDWLPIEVNTLNKALGYKYEFTPNLLTEPSTPQEAAYIVAKLFERSFMSSPVEQSGG